ncbi:hypothetical protein FSARC_14730 [Fusarium sarcochroum]|uniref:Uncharacterized protein n=1 Tax=Fusarium sarcochroum TaxID=1208366 RepID=A0A8H4SR93_9HYPO|nr:hypothetical protein FSARC_14730 [Fusarium sarcochroum]
MKFFLLVLVLLKLVSAVRDFRWTLHSSCYENAVYKEALTKAMETAKSRSALCASRINNPFHRSYKKLAKILVPKDEDLEILKERYRKFDNVKGPIGEKSGFAASPDWTDRNDPFRNDFLLYCATDLDELDDGHGRFIPWDNARKRPLKEDNALVVIQRDIEAGTWHNENYRVEAATAIAPPAFLPAEEGAKVADTITFNPIWLETKIANGDLLFNTTTLEKMKKEEALDELKKGWKNGKQATPVDHLIGSLEGTLLHEMFHLSAFGSHKDLPDNGRAYGWMNNVKYKEVDNPELMAILGLMFDLKKNHKVTVNEAGELK